MNNFKNFKKFWETEVVTTSNLEGLSKNFYYDKVDLNDPYHGLEKPFSITFNEPWVLKEKELVKISGLTWIDMAEKECIEDYKQKIIDTILMGDYKKEMKMNRVELEMQRLREGTGENYMLNKMINTDGVNFFAEYTLYKDYNKYFGLTLDGESINIIEIMEEEFAEFLSHYRLSAMYPQIEAVHEDTWDITPEENERIREKLYTAQTDSYTPVYNEGNIVLNGNIVAGEDWLHNSSMLGISGITNSKEYLWTETSTNTSPDCTESWTETSTNTGKRCSVPSTFSIDAEQLKGIPMELHLKGVRSGFILIKDPTIKSVEERPIKNTENKSRTELVDKVVAVVIEELLTKGTCSLNITLGQE